MPKVFKKTKPELTKDESDNDPVRTLLEWKAPSRPYRKKDFSYYRTIAIIVVLLIFISIIAKEFLLIGALLAFSFVTYVLGFVPPEDIEFKISTQGVTIGDTFYFWDDLDSFWFSEKEGKAILNVLTRLRFPAQLMILIGQLTKDEVRNIVARYLPYQEIAPKSLVDTWAESLQRHFPLEKTSVSKK
ncbi:hypothetical protein M1563_01015 [Patescibacteria group bacterium]|nr:hypothetical protein [Patescibacteria group bacterium]MCL5410170.1 hypothetical protein [Patescibacteria group bacterium]